MTEQKVPYVVFEGEMTRFERTIKRLWILCILLLVALLATNAGWIYYESQWEYFEESTTQEVSQTAESSEGSAVNKFIGGDYNAESNADGQNNKD